MTAVVTDAMVSRGAEALAGIAHMGCTCPWDADGDPPADCRCAERWERERYDLAREVLTAGLTDPRLCKGCTASLADMRADAEWCSPACKMRTRRALAAEQKANAAVRRPGGLQVAFGPAVNAMSKYLSDATPLSAREARQVAERVLTYALSVKQRARAKRRREADLATASR